MTKRTASKVAWVQEMPDKFTAEVIGATTHQDEKKSSQDIKEFAESTSAHGLKNAVSDKSSRFRRYPIQPQQVLRRMDSLKFPTVTICNLNLADATKANNPDAVTRIFRVAKGGHWPAAYNTTLEDMQHSDVYGPYLRRSYKDLIQELSSEVDEVFSFCTWNGEMVSCSDMLVPAWTFIGRCFKLNANASHDLVSTRAGFNGGFFATLKTSLSGHTVSGQSSYGFKALVHHMYDFPDVYSKGLLLSPGFSYHVSLQESKLKYLPYPYKAQGDMYCSEYETLNETDTDMVLSDNTGASFHSVTACIFYRANDKATAICGCDMKSEQLGIYASKRWGRG
ncbi:acid-sensing ion channel 1-like [Elysia marginata]|uniref:Acid-sensing ion channel 1-like n=1 Tax=Elysia marginata TaxID=1093978 RepID=A0AAV4JU77_9GAST|nr:acid-sensing ion channel 1-like [Elysia marginata]